VRSGFLLLGLLAGCKAASIPAVDWRTTGGAPGNTRFSPLDQINVTNVAQLQVAWVYHTGDLAPDGHGEIQATPIVVDGVLYATTPKVAVIALRAAGGTLLWRFDAFPNRPTQPHVNRGVVYWADERGHDRRIFFAVDRRLYALDARTGEPIRSFGDSGWVDLGEGLGQDVGDRYLVSTSPGVAYKDVLIWGTRVGEEAGSAPGHIRAYEARTGKIRWTFHTIPWPAEFGYDTWPPEAFQTAGGANSWAGMTVDSERGIVYIPTGSATPDFYGGDRVGANLFANSLLALDAATGKRIWHFQTVHHGLWDYDLCAAPQLITVQHEGKTIEAVAVAGKVGFLYVFNRLTGEPLWPIVEREVPPSDVPQERADERRAVALPDEVGLSDEEIDPERGPTQPDHGGVFGMVVDQVALELPDRPAVELDQVEVGRVLAAHGGAVLADRVVGVDVRRDVVVPASHVRTQEPGADEVEILLAEGNEAVRTELSTT